MSKAELPPKPPLTVVWGGRIAASLAAGGIGLWVAGVLTDAFRELLGPLLSPEGVRSVEAGLRVLLAIPPLLAFTASWLYLAAALRRDFEGEDELASQSALVTTFSTGAFLLGRAIYGGLFLGPVLLLDQPARTAAAVVGGALWAAQASAAFEGVVSDSIRGAFTPDQLWAELRSTSSKRWGLFAALGALWALVMDGPWVGVAAWEVSVWITVTLASRGRPLA